MSEAVKSDRGGENTSPQTYAGTPSTDAELAKQSSGSFPEYSRSPRGNAGRQSWRWKQESGPHKPWTSHALLRTLDFSPGIMGALRKDFKQESNTFCLCDRMKYGKWRSAV